MIDEYFSLAFKNLRHRGARSWLTMLGIFIGIAAVVSLITMGQGLRTAIEGQFGTISVDTLTIQNQGTGFGPPGSTVVDKLNEDDLRILESIGGIEFVVPRFVRVGGMEYNKVSGFGYAADIPEEKEKAEFVYDSIDLEVAEGRFLESGDTNKVFLGNNFLTTDDFGKKFRVGKNVKLNGENFEIVGFAESSSSLQMNGVVFLTTTGMKELFDVEDEYDLFVVKVRDKDEVEEIANEIERRFRNDRDEKVGEESFSVETPLQALSSVNTILNIINLVVIGIASISLFVGGVGIANTMYTSVLERTKEIGIMKAIGARNADVMYLFLIESGLLGLVGGIVGALIGLGAAFGIGAIANQAIGGNLFNVAISYPLLIGSVGFSFFVGIISGILPAIQASKLNVVDALRG